MTQAASYFDGWAARYDRDLQDFGYTLPGLIAQNLPVLMPPSPSILDIGIGTGLIAAAIRQVLPAAQISGVDASPRMLDICRARDVAQDLRLCDAGNQILPYGDGSFDAALSIGVLEFIDNPVWLLAQAARVLKSGGIALLAFETIESAPLYKPGLIRGMVSHTPECAVIRRVQYTPWLKIYNKYLHNARYVAEMAHKTGLQLQDRQEVVAYTRPNHGPVAHDILVFKKA